MDYKEARKRNLRESIDRQYRLLNEYEIQRDLSQRPKEVELANIEITSITLSLGNYIEQYRSICVEQGEPGPEEVTTIWNELKDLRRGQQQLLTRQDETLAAIDRARSEILMKTGAGYRDLTIQLLSALNEQEVQIVGAIVSEIDGNQLSEMEISEGLAAIKAGYEALISHPLAKPMVGEPANQLPQVWSSPDVSSAGKLKLSIPLIPAILSYDTELSFSVKESLSSLWNRYFKGKELLI